MISKGARVSVQISEPWDLGERLAWRELTGEIAVVDASENAVLIELDVSVSDGKDFFLNLVASPRHEGKRIADLSVEDSIICSFTGLTDERAQSKDPLDISWWRGGGLVFLGDLRLMPH